MKKLFFCLLAAALSVTAFAQAQLETRKFRISDFKEKTLQVVLTGNEIIDASLREECRATWHLSPWEMCSEQQFEKRKSSEDYYFLVVVDSRFPKEEKAGIKMLGLYKGCPKAGEGLEGLFKVVAVPFCSAENPNGDELLVLPALLTILQSEVERDLGRTLVPSKTIRMSPAKKLNKWSGHTCIDENCLDFDITGSYKAILKEYDILISKPGVSAQHINGKTSGFLAGYLVGPDNTRQSKICYVMVIDCFSYNLLYIARHSVKKGKRPGFSSKDISNIRRHLEK